jgi:DNA polymerase III delta subunit
MVADRANDFIVCKTLKVWPQDRQRPFMAAAKKLGVRRAAAMLKMIVELDSRSKSGLGNFGPNLERFCVQFTSALR